MHDMSKCCAEGFYSLMKRFSDFRNLFGIILLRLFTIHLLKSVKKLHVHIARSVGQSILLHIQILHIFLIILHI